MSQLTKVLQYGNYESQRYGPNQLYTLKHFYHKRYSYHGLNSFISLSGCLSATQSRNEWHKSKLPIPSLVSLVTLLSFSSYPLCRCRLCADSPRWIYYFRFISVFSCLSLVPSLLPSTLHKRKKCLSRVMEPKVPATKKKCSNAQDTIGIRRRAQMNTWAWDM